MHPELYPTELREQNQSMDCGFVAELMFGFLIVIMATLGVAVTVMQLLMWVAR